MRTISEEEVAMEDEFHLLITNQERLLKERTDQVERKRKKNERT